MVIRALPGLLVLFFAVGVFSAFIELAFPPIKKAEATVTGPNYMPTMQAEVPTIEQAEVIFEPEKSLKEQEEQELIEELMPIPRISASEPGECYYYELSDEDKTYIAKVVYKEAGGEIFEGKVAVAAVVLNRFFQEDNGLFDQTSIYAIVTQPGQFASIDDVTQETLDSNPQCMEAVEAACKGWDPTRVTFENGAKYFYAPSEVHGYQASIREGVETLSIGNHNFHNDFRTLD